MGTNARLFPRRGARTGFTLVEVLLVLALLALIGLVLLPAAGRMVPHPGGGSWEDNVAETFQAARRESVVSGHELVMHYDAESRSLVWPGGSSEPLAAEGVKLTAEFLRPGSGSAILLGGQLVETTTMPVLHFYPDGTCDPVRVQLRADGTPPRVLAIDPWTCAPGLEEKR